MAHVALVGTLTLAVLLSACAAGGSAVNGATTETPSATATLAPTATAAPPLALPFHLPPADTAQLCKGAFGDRSSAVYVFSHDVYAEPAFALSYPSYVLPAGTPLKPFDLGTSTKSSDLDRVFGGPANANPSISQPGGITFTVCNNGLSTITLKSVGMGIVAVKPHASPIDTWLLCDGAYQPGVGGVGGCGGAISGDETLHVAFPASASTGATALATVISAGGPNGYGPLPVTLKPGATITALISVAMPTAPGVYTLGITLSASGVTGAPAYAPLAPQLFAPVAHKWNYNNCKTPAMTSQIPSTATSSYFICP